VSGGVTRLMPLPMNGGVTRLMPLPMNASTQLTHTFIRFLFDYHPFIANLTKTEDFMVLMCFLWLLVLKVSIFVI